MDDRGAGTVLVGILSGFLDAERVGFHRSNHDGMCSDRKSVVEEGLSRGCADLEVLGSLVDGLVSSTTV